MRLGPDSLGPDLAHLTLILSLEVSWGILVAVLFFLVYLPPTIAAAALGDGRRSRRVLTGSALHKRFYRSRVASGDVHLLVYAQLAFAILQLVSVAAMEGEVGKSPKSLMTIVCWAIGSTCSRVVEACSTKANQQPVLDTKCIPSRHGARPKQLNWFPNLRHFVGVYYLVHFRLSGWTSNGHG